MDYWHIGGDLNPNRLLEAYRKGIFPWYSETQPIMVGGLPTLDASSYRMS